MSEDRSKPTSVDSTLECLPTYQVAVDAQTPVSGLKAYFDRQPNLPGVIVTSGGRFISAITRDGLFRQLLRPFAQEIFHRRPIREFLEVWPQQILLCKSTCSVHQAAELALDRSGDFTDAPIVVEYPDGHVAILDMHALLVAQSQALALSKTLEKQKQAAESANHAKSEFLASISHELRTPLHGICSFARFGKDEADSAERHELRDYFCRVEQCADALLNLVNDLLDLSKLEVGKMRFDYQQTSLSDLVGVVVDEFWSVCSGRQIEVLFDPPDGDTSTTLDPERIKQVVRNLLSNAIKFSPPSGQIRARLRRVGESLLISLCDQGPGIPENELEAIFDKFVQSSKTKSGAGGTGLGLAICREIVAGHGGRIWAENNQGVGSTFYCELPIRAQTPDSAEPTAEDGGDNATLSDPLPAPELVAG